MKLMKVKITTKHINKEIVKELFDLKETYEICTPKEIIATMQRHNFEQDIENYEKAYKILDGLETEIVEMLGEYILNKWNTEDENIIKEFTYLISQDSLMGFYVNDREGFEEKWEEEKSLIDFTEETVGFTRDMFEIITEVKI